MQIHCVQFDIAWEDKAANHARVDAMLEALRPTPGGLIVLPELGDVGFSFALDRIIDDRSERWACQLAARWKCWVVHGWAMRGADGAGRNVSGLCSPDGTLVGVAEKMHPFTQGNAGGVYMPGDRVRVFDVDGVGLCPLVCYDLRFPESFRDGVRDGAEMYTVIANWPAQRATHWRALLIARAIENQAIVVGCNRVGKDPAARYAGGSLIVDAEGVVVAEGGDGDEVLSADVDVAGMRRWREAFGVLGDVRWGQGAAGTLSSTFSWREMAGPGQTPFCCGAYADSLRSSGVFFLGGKSRRPRNRFAIPLY